MTVTTTHLAAPTDAHRDPFLASTLRDLAADRNRWEPLVRFANPRVGVRLDTGPEVEAWLLMWSPGQGTGLHDHGGASGCFTVLRETMAETVVDAVGGSQEFRYRAGDVRSFDTDFIHDMRNAGTVGAVTLHVYRPELTQMTHYTAEDGLLIAVETRYAGRHW